MYLSVVFLELQGLTAIHVNGCGYGQYVISIADVLPLAPKAQFARLGRSLDIEKWLLKTPPFNSSLCFWKMTEERKLLPAP